jgi:phospho-N-acetylmuramoyl-pentapeptide-transferase
MLYYLFDWIHQTLKPPGFGVFKYLTFRSALAAITALVFSLYLGPKIIARLKAMQIREEKKVDAPKRHLSKAGTPTMGGLIVLCATLGPVLLWGDLKSIFIILICSGTFVLGAVGFLDDYLKVIKKLPNGLIGRYKILGQVIAGIFIGTMVYVAPEFHPFNTVTTMPFLKNINFDFSIFYIPIVVFIITATSNAVNLTDGLDGLAIGLTTIAMLAMALICYVTGNAVYAHYLNIVFIKGSGELVVFIAALIGAGLGFLWFNSYPEQVFMGDTGSLALGGAFGILSVLVIK